MKRVIYISTVLLSLLFITSCKKEPLDRDQYNKVVILYMAANNNLSSFATHNIAAIKEGYLPEKESRDILVIYRHIEGEQPKLNRLFLDEKGVVTEESVTVYEDHNSADGEILKSVLNRVKKIFPSKEYGLILWSHATGWLPEGYYNSSQHQTFFQDPYRGIVKSFAEDRGVEMELKELKGALTYPLSFIIFDCCLMGGIETLYELKEQTKYIVASPTEVLAYGFPYSEIMAPLFKKESNLREVCQLYYDHYNGQTGINRSATIALYKTERLEKLSTISKEIFNSNREKIETVELANIQRYFRMNKRWYWDLDSFIEQIATPSQYSQFNSALNEVVVGKWYTPYFLDVKIDHFGGISSYIQNPKNSFLDQFYQQLEWNIGVNMVE